METEEEKKKNEEEAKRKADEEAKAKASAGTDADPDKGNKQKTPQSIIDANTAAERLEEANKKHEENLNRQEDMITRKILSGVTEAGTETRPQYSDEETASRARIKAVADASGSAWAKKYE